MLSSLAIWVFSENWILAAILPVVFLNKYVGAFVWCCGQDSSPSELCFTEGFSKCISKAVFLRFYPMSTLECAFVLEVLVWVAAARSKSA